MFGRILLAIDQSAASWEAARLASHLAGKLRAKVLVLHVYEPQSKPGMPADEREREYHAAESLVEDVAQQISTAGAWARSEVRAAEHGEVAEEILKAAADPPADLIVIGSRGRSSAAGLLLGSVSQEVVACADCPVLVVRSADDVASGSPRRVLLAVEGLDGIDSLIATTSELARAAGADVIVAHVSSPSADELDRMTHRTQLTRGQQAATEAVKRLAAAGVHASTMHLRNRNGIAHELARAAETHAADMIVVGSRSLTSFGEWADGSTSQSLMRRTRRPVLVSKEHPLDRGR